MAYQSYSYSGPSYNPPPQQSAYYNPPGPRSYQPPAPSPAPPAPAGSYDPFRAYYADRLRELTFNSRPLIQELSVLAMQQRDQNHWGNMTAVVEEIEGAVYRSPPHEKLPKLYLLDSISKNVGPPYTTHLLQQTIPRLYIRTHREVDGVTKVKMEEMISLWRRSGPNGEELYGPAAREAVEREIFGASAANALGGGREIITRDSVLGAIHSTIAVKQGEASQRPWDRGVQTQLTALMGLSEMLNTRIVQPGELQQIMDQLQGMGYASPAVPPNQTGYNQPQRSPMPPFPPTPVPHQPPAVQTYPPNNAVNLPPFAPTLQQHYDAPTATPPYPTSTPVLQVSTPLPAPIPTAAPAAPLFDANMLSILSSLTGAGGIANAGIRTPDLAVVQPKVRTKLDDYEDMVLSLNLSLSNLDMNRMTALPLEHLPIQCSQCSARFPSEGDQLNAHMDWHARRNKSERNASGRGAHRRWLPRAEEWVNDIPVAGSSTAPDTIAGTTGTDGNDSVGTGATANTTSIKAPKSAEELQRKWVRVPTVPGAAAAVCPVCKDGFKREWSEKEEEWVWRNAIDINGKIMHATCRQQQLTANRLARVGKGRSGSAGTKSISKSPGMTPEPLIGVKVEPHPLSHSIASTAADLSQSQTDLVAVTTGGEGEESGGMGKRKADEEAEEERKRVKMEPTETGEQNVSESAVVEEVVGGQGVVASVV